MDFRSMNEGERQNLLKALRSNVENKAAITTNPQDTSFVGFTDEISDDEVISQIRSVPTHY